MTVATAIETEAGALVARGSGRENVDHLIPKSTDAHVVATGSDGRANLVDGAQDKAGGVLSGALGVPQHASFLDALGYEFLDWPQDLGAGRLSARAMQASLGDARFDAIIVREPPAIGEIAAIWKNKSLHVLPVIDLTGTLGAAADLDASRLKARETDEVRHVVRRFQDRRALLHRDLLLSDNLGEQLVGRVFVSGRSLIPAFDPASRDLVAYNTLPGATLVGREAEALCGEGLFKRTFFERLHACTRCHSRRLIVREECARCHSSHLGEEQYVHHFRCAFQGPEATSAWETILSVRNADASSPTSATTTTGPVR